MVEWYPSDLQELKSLINRFLVRGGKKSSEIHGLVVPHAGYIYSGAVAGKGFACLKNKKFEKAIIVGPSHYASFSGIRSLDKIKTPFGEPEILKSDYEKLYTEEHSVTNQVAFLQFLGINKILPLVVGHITEQEAKQAAEHLSEEDALFVFSTDLSHFLEYGEAVITDKHSIEVIQKLDVENYSEIDACGVFPILIMMHLCKLKGWKPRLLQYKNSGDITGDNSSVVGYASFVF